MSVHIRLTRVGATKRPAYRVIAIDSRRSRDGRALEILGYYDPLTDPITVKLDRERIATWMARGAKPSAAVERLMRASTEPRPATTPRPATEAPAKPKRTRRVAAAEGMPGGAEAARDTAGDAEPERAEPESLPADAAATTATTTDATGTDA